MVDDEGEMITTARGPATKTAWEGVASGKG